MANSYKPGKWSGTLSADLAGDASKTTPTLGDDYDNELKNLKKAQSNIKNTISQIKKEVTALKNHADTGKMATNYLTNTIKRLTKIQNSLDNEVKALTNTVNQAQKEEWQRIKKIVSEWEAAQQKQV